MYRRSDFTFKQHNYGQQSHNYSSQYGYPSRKEYKGNSTGSTLHSRSHSTMQHKPAHDTAVAVSTSSDAEHTITKNPIVEHTALVTQQNCEKEEKSNCTKRWKEERSFEDIHNDSDDELLLSSTINSCSDEESSNILNSIDEEQFGNSELPSSTLYNDVNHKETEGLFADLSFTESEQRKKKQVAELFATIWSLKDGQEIWGVVYHSHSSPFLYLLQWNRSHVYFSLPGCKQKSIELIKMNQSKIFMNAKKFVTSDHESLW
jgi:hypothetical protein